MAQLLPICGRRCDHSGSTAPFTFAAARCWPASCCWYSRWNLVCPAAGLCSMLSGMILVACRDDVVTVDVLESLPSWEEAVQQRLKGLPALR